ncbi:MAG: Flp pilus assembly complex ATPase component TadA [Candidatus Omnitrophica bacterium]|nr:Flp pilus assembly complex ATPase component TadA [Candidatus Omnitrophota bacterium]
MAAAKTIVFFGTKGGVGRSTLASNTAVMLAEEFKYRVLLLDFDLLSPGDLSKILDITTHRTLVDLLLDLENLSKDLEKQNFLDNYRRLPLDFLAAILQPEQASLLQKDLIPKAFDLFKTHYDFIIIDNGRLFNEISLEVLNEANLIILVVCPDILSIYQAKSNIEILQRLHIPLGLLKVLINRAEAVSSYTWQEVSISLSAEIIGKIPSDGSAVMRALNSGVPVVLDNPRARFSKALRKFIEDMLKKEKLFVEHKTIADDLISLYKEVGDIDFWQRKGLAVSIEKPFKEELDEITRLKRSIHERLIEEMKIKRIDPKIFSNPQKIKELKEKAEKLVSNLLLSQTGYFINSDKMRNQLIKDIVDEALGLGPLEDLLADPEITDIMVNNKDEVYVERNGKLILTNKKFSSNEQIRTIIERIIAPIGRRIDESVPMVDARLPDGSRVNAIIPPLSLSGPTLTIRKFRKELLTIESLIKLNTLNQMMAEFLRACVLTRKNIIVSGGTGSGKTTMLNILSEFIPDNERIVTIEDAAELRLHQEHWIRMESRPPNIEGKGAITIRDLFRNSLRMRPDRIIIGECRGVETLDMLQAMNTGHDGSMTTLHANSTQDVLVRLDSLILMAGVELPIRAIREMVASAIDIIVHTARLSDGSRKILQITEVRGMKDEVHIDLQDIFIFKQTGVDIEGKVLGEFKATGYIPSFLEEIKLKGIDLKESIFRP